VGIRAVIIESGAGGSPAPVGGAPIASYELRVGDQSRRRVAFHTAESAPRAAGMSIEVIDLDEDCVAKLLSDAVAVLASGAGVEEIDEPAFEKPPGKKRSAGIVLVDERGWLTIREPANHFDGYEHSYAKGRIDPGETPQQTARRELQEETGLIGRIVGLIGDFPGHTSVTRFYVGVRTGGEETPDRETWAIKTVSPFAAMELLNVRRDKKVLVRLIELAASTVEWPWTLAGESMRCRLMDGRLECTPSTPADA
jgi:8-oxo-dGTP pyrophosphatase MutT (NUDIX family)